MSQYTSYWLYQKYEKRGDQDWLPCYPNVLSVDADGTRQRVVKEENDTGCGYAPEPDAEYRWIQVPISEDYICNYCPIYRWHEAPVTDYYCSGTTKWTKEYYQVSLDNGVTWNNVVPEQTRKGNTIIEEESMDCGYVPPAQYEWRRITPVSGDSSTFICDTCCVSQYRWVDLDVSTDYYCSGTTKYYKQQKQVSIDCGESWDWVSPAEYQWGASAQAWSTDCGYVPMERTTSGTPYCSGQTGYDKYVDVYSQVSYDGGSTWQTTATTPTLIEVDSEDCGFVFNGKFRATYTGTGGTSYSAACDSSTKLTLDDTKPSGYDRYSMVTAEIGDCVTSIGGEAFSQCVRLTSVTIPDSVTTIDGNYAFATCVRLPSITIPDSVTSIGDGAFYGCSGLASIDIPSGVTSIGSQTFYNCSGLTSCTIGSGVTSIGGEAFINCNSLTSIVIPDSVTSIGGDAFFSCDNLASIDIPDSVTSIGGGAFAYCRSLTSCTIGSGVTSVGSSAFFSCYSVTNFTVGSDAAVGVFGGNHSLQNVIIDDNVTSISNSAFTNCSSLTSIDIPDSVTSIGNSAFQNCSGLTSIDIPDSVTSIGSSAFRSCRSITSITIPDSVTSIGGYAFAGCRSLTSITIERKNPPTLNNANAFQGTPIASGTGYIYVPSSSVDAYKQASGWSTYANQIQPIT